MIDDKRKVANLIEDLHNKKLTDGHLPPKEAKLGRSKTTVRISSLRCEGVDWQYQVNQKSVHVELHFHKHAVDRYDACARLFAADQLEFDEPIKGNVKIPSMVSDRGAKNPVTRKLGSVP